MVKTDSEGISLSQAPLGVRAIGGMETDWRWGPKVREDRGTLVYSA